jgi:hypothetical protein
VARLLNIDRKLNILSGRACWRIFLAYLNFLLPQRDWLKTFRLSVPEALAGNW